MKRSAKLRLMHVASSHLIGLTNQETQLALAYSKLDEIDLLVVTGEKEQVTGLSGTLAQAGVATEVITGFDVHARPWKLIRDFSRIVRAYRPDVVSVNTNWQLLIAGLSRLFAREKFGIVYTIHGFRNTSPVKSIVARIFIAILLLVFADTINAPSSYTRRKFLPLSYKTKSVPLGEDRAFFDASETPDFSAPMRICFPGRFAAGKNQELLLQAFSKYVVEASDKEARLLLCGDGERLERVRRLSTELNISGQVVFTGQLNRSEVLDVYRTCQIAVIPSNSETFGHCIAEPLVLRRIVLSRFVGIAPDYIRHGENGFLFSTEDELSDLLLLVGRASRQQLEAISQRAGSTGKIFDWPTVAKNNIEILLKPSVRNA